MLAEGAETQRNLLVSRRERRENFCFAQRTQRRREILPPRHQGTKNLIPLSSRSQIAIQLLLPYRDLLENLRSISLFCPQINADVLKLKTKISAAQPSIFTNANLPSPAVKTDSVERSSPRHFSVSIDGLITRPADMESSGRKALAPNDSGSAPILKSRSGGRQNVGCRR